MGNGIETLMNFLALYLGKSSPLCCQNLGSETEEEQYIYFLVSAFSHYNFQMNK